MTFHKTKRAVICVAAASWLVLCVAGASPAHAEDSKAGAAGGEGGSNEGSGEEKKRLNSVRLSAVYEFHLLDHRNSATTDEPLHTRENLGGFEIAYERELIEEHLSIELAKPFLFSEDSWETPFEATLKGLFVKGSWEGYIGAVLRARVSAIKPPA